MPRALPIVFFLALLGLAAWRIQPVKAGQAAIPPKRPGHENILFWVNHNGLSQLDVLGEVEFGDMARILARRRANEAKIRSLRDTFTFPVQKVELLDTADTFRVDWDGNDWVWRHKPSAFVLGANLTFNLPLIVHNRSASPVEVDARYQATTSDSSFAPVSIAANQASGFFLRVVETNPGAVKGTLTVKAGARETSAEVRFDVRPLARLQVTLAEPARVYITGSDGLAYAPAGHSDRMTAMGAEHYFYAQGSFELDVPAGQTTIEAVRGIEYEPQSKTVDLKAGAATTVALSPSRWVQMTREGWYSSDAHIHANYSATHHQTVSAEDIRLQTLAEDVNYSNLMVANSSGAFLHDQQYFEGKPHRLSTPGHLMVWGEEMRNAGVYGHMCFYNLKRLVEPLYTGFRNTPNWEDYPPNYEQAKAARAQGGAVTYAHPTRSAVFETSSAAELPVDLALGEVDAMDVLANTDEMTSMQLWYRLLNCGLRLAISAGTDSFTNVADHYIPGGGRLYAWSGDRLDVDTWIASYKSGRSFASNGPMISLKVDGKEPGSDLRLAAGRRKVTVEGTLRTKVAVDRLELIVNGAVAKALPIGASFREELDLSQSSWVALRALGPWNRAIVNDKQVFAHTSPVYVHLGGGKIVVREDARFYREWVEKLIAKTERNGRFANESKRAEVTALFRKALDYYRSLEVTP